MPVSRFLFPVGSVLTGSSLTFLFLTCMPAGRQGSPEHNRRMVRAKRIYKSETIRIRLLRSAISIRYASVLMKASLAMTKSPQFRRFFLLSETPSLPGHWRDIEMIVNRPWPKQYSFQQIFFNYQNSGNYYHQSIYLSILIYATSKPLPIFTLRIVSLA